MPVRALLRLFLVVGLPLVPSWINGGLLGTKHSNVGARAHVVLITVRWRVHGEPPPQNSSNRSCISFLVPPSDVLLTLLYPTLYIVIPLSLYLYIYLYLSHHLESWSRHH